jgi:hypothetical protein
MASLAAARVAPVPSASFARFAGPCAVLTGVLGFVYAVAFVLLRSTLLSSACLLLAGLLGTAALVALYEDLRETDAAFALWALALGLVGSLGSAVHGGYDLSNALHPPATANLDLPSQIDPRGLLTFGVAGISLWIAAWLMLRGARFPAWLGYLGYLTAALLIVVYLARLIVLDAASPLVLLPAAALGFVASPAFYIGLGVSLWRGARA